MSSSNQPRALPREWREIAFREPHAVLLETTSPGASERYSYLFTEASDILIARVLADLPRVFEAVERALTSGSYVAGWFAYEAAAHFFPAEHFRGNGPLAVLGVYGSRRAWDHFSPGIEESSAAPASDLPIAPMMRIDYPGYLAAVERIHEWIAAGDTYQVNFTSSMVTPYRGDAASVYEALRVQQPCRYAAVLRLDPSQTILSLSPELFFRVDAEGTIETRPMKGTAERGASADEDAERAERLRSDEKNRAEHVMIVDLLRNDLGRICTMGSVRVNDLFVVEPYNSLLQMTSTIRGALPQGFRWYDVFRALFPCGSITGAPKHHTIELIGRVEDAPRGVYTGAIGYFAPDRTACFNVAIRTAVLADNRLTLGVGGGIVADSVAADEYAECLLKAGFLQRASEPLSLIETMLWDGELALLNRHLRRLFASAKALGIPLDGDAIHDLIRRESASWGARPLRVRLTVDRSGRPAITTAEAPVWRADLRLFLSPRRTQREAPHFRHKTTFRPEYDEAWRGASDAGYDEAIFLNEEGELGEGCISSLLVRLDGRWYTPPLAAGILPGIYRELLLQQGAVTERSMTLQDMERAEAVALCNAVRGVGYASSLDTPEGICCRWNAPSDADRLLA